MADREKVIRAFEQYVYNFVELTTTDEYNHQILEQVLVLLKEQEEEIHALQIALNTKTMKERMGTRTAGANEIPLKW